MLLLRPKVTYAWLALTVIGLLIKHLDGPSARKASRLRRDDTCSRIPAHPADRIFRLGQPQIYLDAHRRPACRYITTFPLTGYVFGGPIPVSIPAAGSFPTLGAPLEQDFVRHPPTYIVDVMQTRKVRSIQ